MRTDNSDLLPCPDCGGEVVIEGLGGASDPEVPHWVACTTHECSYELTANTRAVAIQHHERLAGRCRWRKKEEVEHSSEVWWKVGCADKHLTSWKYGHPEYCEMCGKKVEEVSE